MRPTLKATAIRLLARREYARAELAERLIGRGADRVEVERVLDELERSGYLSDARFAQAVVAQKAGRYGKRAIAHELRQKHVAPAAARVAPKNEREKARQVRFLLSRGYGTTVALKVLRAAGSADDD